MDIPVTEKEEMIQVIYDHLDPTGLIFMGYPITELSQAELLLALTATYNSVAYWEKKYMELLQECAKYD